GVETIVGAKMDPQFGPVLMFGLGGIFVEVFKDVSFRVAPITDADAEEMISELKAYPLLKGIRGRKPSDISSIVDTLLKISRMMVENGWIKELDLNPVIAYEKGCRIVDARAIL
ncbi:MAG: acetate--CoA ligase family protein, partial [Candidatus Methanosuratincola petrocarbonis]